MSVAKSVFALLHDWPDGDSAQGIGNSMRLVCNVCIYIYVYIYIYICVCVCIIYI